MEFCEVASMAMELLGGEHFDVFYDDPADAARAKRTHARGHHPLLPVDGDDRLVPALALHPPRPHARRADRTSGCGCWTASTASSTGPATRPSREAMWQRQLHLFHVPFYYVEYGIAQLGALQLWMKAKRRPAAGARQLPRRPELGGTRPLPELFAAAGIKFDFSEKTLRPLMQAIGDELETLPR